MKNINNLKLFYIGHLDERSNSFKRFKTYESIVDVVGQLDIDQVIYNSTTSKFDHYFNFGFGTLRLNWILNNLEINQLDILLVDNRPFIFKSTLRKLKRRFPNLKVISVLTDDPFGLFNKGWRLLISTVKHYDIHFVQRTLNINELYNLGSPRVEICYRSFDPGFHRKLPVLRNLHFHAEFIGSYEKERCDSILFLIENGIKVGVTGDGWELSELFVRFPEFYLGPAVFGIAYVEKINSINIALHFLRHANRDEQDSRTFELPACGVAVISEYSDLHASLFLENKEMLFFRNNVELLEKVRFLVGRPDLVPTIGLAGQERCHSSGYDHKSRVISILDKIAE
jgi:spore maturation protein CgeB